MKSNIIISPVVLILLLLVPSILAIHDVLAQSDILTDSDAITYYSNPSEYINKNVNFTGKILTMLPPSSGTLGLQMYQAGDTNRNTIVVYSTPMQLSKDDCVMVTGVTQPATEYENMFGAILSAAVINAESIKKIDCSESIEPAIKTVNLNQTQEKNNIKVTLHKVEFSNKNTRAYLTVENTGTSEDITFNDYNSRAIQGKTQYITTNSYDVDYPKIISIIPAGIEENGVVLFEPLDPARGEAQFRFESSDASYDNILFIYNVSLSPKYDLNTNNITALITAGDEFSNIGESLEAIKYYDRALIIDPNDTQALVGKAKNLAYLNDSAGASKLYSKATSIDPNVFVN